MKHINYCVTEHGLETHQHGFALNILAPFSASAVELAAPYGESVSIGSRPSAQPDYDGLEFYKMLRKHPKETHQILERVTGVLIAEINDKLPRVISVADPYANPRLLSKADIQEYSIFYLARLLKGLDTEKGGVLHICPYMSFLLEEYGFFRVNRRKTKTAGYAEVVSEYARAGKLTVIGNRCIYTQTAGDVLLLEYANQDRECSCNE